MRDGPTDYIKYAVKRRGKMWAVYSSVMTIMSNTPAENFMVENKSKKWCEGFAAAHQSIESRRNPIPLGPPFEWRKAARQLGEKWRVKREEV